MFTATVQRREGGYYFSLTHSTLVQGRYQSARSWSGVCGFDELPECETNAALLAHILRWAAERLDLGSLTTR